MSLTPSFLPVVVVGGGTNKSELNICLHINNECPGSSNRQKVNIAPRSLFTVDGLLVIADKLRFVLSVRL